MTNSAYPDHKPYDLYSQCLNLPKLLPNSTQRLTADGQEAIRSYRRSAINGPPLCAGSLCPHRKGWKTTHACKNKLWAIRGGTVHDCSVSSVDPDRNLKEYCCLPRIEHQNLIGLVLATYMLSLKSQPIRRLSTIYLMHIHEATHVFVLLEDAIAGSALLASHVKQYSFSTNRLSLKTMFYDRH